jgi:hypothetical protein
VVAYARNMLNEQYEVVGLGLGAVVGVDSVILGTPRMAALEVGLKFTEDLQVPRLLSPSVEKTRLRSQWIVVHKKSWINKVTLTRNAHVISPFE